ncbi:MAG: diguanylate cyclase [Actinomycetota bacterium]|nr:diguanylate cyclase [Actinomycetota bacterium]
MTESTIAVFAASGAVLVLASTLAVRALRMRTRQRLEVMLGRVDHHLESISDALRSALDRAEELEVDAVREHELTWDALATAHERLGYEAELELEIDRARATRRPLSLVVLDVRDLARSEGVEHVTTLLERVTRAGDRVVRGGDDELVVLLPETTAEAAWHYQSRLRGELEKSFAGAGAKLTVLTDVVEWRPNETSRSLGARARQAVDRANVTPLERRADALDMPGPG